MIDIIIIVWLTLLTMAVVVIYLGINHIDSKFRIVRDAMHALAEASVPGYKPPFGKDED